MASRRTPPGRRSRPGSTFPVFPIALGVVILGFVIGAAIAAMRHGGGTAVALTTAAPSAAQPATATQAPSAVQVATDAPAATQPPSDAPTHAPTAPPTMAAVADASPAAAPSVAPSASAAPASPAPSASAAPKAAPQHSAATQAPAPAAVAQHAVAQHAVAAQHAAVAAQLQQAIAVRNAPPPPPTPVGSHGLIATTASTHVTMTQPEPPPPPPPPVDQGATADPNAQLLHDAQDAVRTYIGAVAAGDDATAKAQLLANSGTSQATLLEKSFLDPGARIVDMSARATSPTTAVIDADIQTQKGLYYGHFEVRRLDSGIVLISLHSAVKA